MTRLLLLVGLASLSSACATYATLQTTRPLGKGVTQVAVEPGVVGAMSGTDLGGVAPRVDLSIRHGVTEAVDIGARLGLGGLDVFGKFLVMEGDDSLRIALVPTAGLLYMGSGSGGGGGGVLNLSLPVLFGVPLGEHELIVGPKLYNTTLFGGVSEAGGAINVLMGGATVGFAARLAGGFTLLPEIAVLTPLVGSSTSTSQGTESTSLADTGATGVQLSVGLLFGGK